MNKLQAFRKLAYEPTCPGAGQVFAKQVKRRPLISTRKNSKKSIKMWNNKFNNPR
jgi:hypothetical protein